MKTLGDENAPARNDIKSYGIDSVILLRLRRKDVLVIAKEYPEIKQLLDIAKEKNSAQD